MKQVVLGVLALICLISSGGEAQERISVRPEPGTPVVALEVRVAAGPADELPHQAGLAYLTARSVAVPLRAALDSIGVHLTVHAQKDAIAFGLAAAPEVWDRAMRLLLTTLFRDPADPGIVAREREAIRAELLARASNPADALLRETDAAVYGLGHPWARPTVGTPATLEGISAREVDTFLRTFFVPARTTLALVGPVEPGDAKRRMLAVFPAATWNAPLNEAGRPSPEPVQTPYNSITAWVSVSYPVAADADVETLGLLAELVRDRLEFGPSRRSVYNVRGEVLRHGGGAELRIQMVVPPREAGLWTEQIRSAVAAYAGAPLPRAVWDSVLRRYRGNRLRQLATPEARAAADAEALLLAGRVADAERELDSLSAQRLADTAAALPRPVVVVLGPTETHAD